MGFETWTVELLRLLGAAAFVQMQSKSCRCDASSNPWTFLKFLRFDDFDGCFLSSNHVTGDDRSHQDPKLAKQRSSEGQKGQWATSFHHAFRIFEGNYLTPREVILRFVFLEMLSLFERCFKTSEEYMMAASERICVVDSLVNRSVKFCSLTSKFCFGFLTDLTECLFERNVHGPTLLQGVDGVADDSAKRVLHEMQNNFAIWVNAERRLSPLCESYSASISEHTSDCSMTLIFACLLCQLQ